MPCKKRESADVLYALVNNTSRPDWMRKEALQELCSRKCIHYLKKIVNNTSRPGWMRKMALNGIKGSR